MEKDKICPECGGDGKETCNNPDHGSLTNSTWGDTERLGCPCCGHDPEHKVINGGDCELCNGTGIIKIKLWKTNKNEHKNGITFIGK